MPGEETLAGEEDRALLLLGGRLRVVVGNGRGLGYHSCCVLLESGVAFAAGGIVPHTALELCQNSAQKAKGVDRRALSTYAAAGRGTSPLFPSQGIETREWLANSTAGSAGFLFWPL